MNRKQRRRSAALQRKTEAKIRQRWENRVVNGFVELGWTENQVRSHMRYIRALSSSMSTAVYSITPVKYVKAIIDGYSKQAKNSK